MTRNRLPLRLSAFTLLILFIKFLGAHSVVLFSPDDKPAKHFIKLINKAESRIYGAVYILTDKKIAQALARAKYERGVDVQLITDETCLDNKYEQVSLLKQANIDVFLYPSVASRKGGRAQTKSLMHHKFAIIDNTLWTGSYNWTHGGNSRNQENVIINDEKSVVKRFLRQFEILKKRCFKSNALTKTAAQPKRSFKQNLQYLLGRIWSTKPRPPQ